MTASSTSFFKRLTLADAFFVLLAVVGGVVYFWLLPGQHPDAAADLSLGEAQAIEIAERFLTQAGWPVDTLSAEAEFKRANRLLDSLQQKLGRTEAVRLLRSGEVAYVPAYYWQVRWATDKQNENWRQPSTYLLYLTQTGAVWWFENNAPARQQARPDRKALAQVLAPDDVETAYTSLRELPDSTLEEAFSFADTDTLARHDERAGLLSLTPETDPPSIVLDSTDAVGLARYHLGDVPLSEADLTFRVDSVRAATAQDPTVEVFFHSETPLHEQPVQATVTVLPTGTLRSLDVTFNPGSRNRSGLEIGDLVPIVMGFLLFLLILSFAVLFFRRLIGRTIDVKAALLDGFIVGVITMGLIVFSKQVITVSSDDSIWEILLAFLLVLPLLGGLAALFVALISGATDSIARPAWPEKVATMSLVRKVSLLNQQVGAAVLRGTLLAYALLGVMTLTLVALPMANINADSYDGLLGETRSLIGFNFTLAGWYGYLVLALVLLGVGSLLYRRFKRGWVVVPVTALLITLLMPFPQLLVPGLLTWAQTAVFALLIALCFWRYDFLTTFVTFFFTWALWSAGPGWLAEGTSLFLDFALSHVVAVGALTWGGAGVMSSRTGEERGAYVPPYVQEMAQQERLKREVEIARSVQESFLPRRMPEVAGLDMAAMCLAAYEVGGDYYDFVKLGSGKLAVVVGDVSGKGTQAAFYMTLTKGFVQTLSREGLSPAEVMRRLNMLFCENVTRGTFISMIYGVIDVDARTFTFARAGHNPVILKRSPSQEPDLVQPSGLAIGLVTGSTFDDTIEERTLNLRIGDVLVFYTDGFSEAMNMAKDQYGDDRLARKVGDLGQRSATEILHGIAEDVHHFVEAAGRHDDMTMVVVKLDRSAAQMTASAAHQHAVAEA